MSTYRKDANNRAEFARQKYAEIIKSFTITKTGNVIDGISGVKARKLNQAYQIYIYYLNVFNGSSPRGTAVYVVQERNQTKRKKNRNFLSRRQLLSSDNNIYVNKEDVLTGVLVPLIGRVKL